MKKLIIVLLSIVTLSSFAQKRSVNIGDFNEVKTYNGLIVTLYKADKPAVIVLGDDTDEVIIKNVDGVLKIYAKLGKKVWGEDLYIKVYYTTLETIDANEGSSIKSNAVFKQNNLTVKAQEGAKIRLNLAIKHLDIKTISGGEIHLEGEAESQIIIANTGGMYNGFSLKTTNTTVKAVTGGEVDIYVTDYVKATANTGGMIYIKGNPKNVKNKSNLGGEIKILK
jgi:hypothetical protein